MTVGRPARSGTNPVAECERPHCPVETSPRDTLQPANPLVEQSGGEARSTEKSLCDQGEGLPNLKYQ